MTGTRTHVAEYTDRLGNRLRIEYEVANDLGGPTAGELIGGLWELTKGLYVQAGYRGNPVHVLANHEEHGGDLEDYMTREDS